MDIDNKVLAKKCAESFTLRVGQFQHLHRPALQALLEYYQTGLLVMAEQRKKEENVRMTAKGFIWPILDDQILPKDLKAHFETVGIRSLTHYLSTATSPAISGKLLVMPEALIAESGLASTFNDINNLKKAHGQRDLRWETFRHWKEMSDQESVPLPHELKQLAKRNDRPRNAFRLLLKPEEFKVDVSDNVDGLNEPIQDTTSWDIVVSETPARAPAP